MIEQNKIYNMDCLNGMKLLDDNFIDLTITSPPYDNLRNYNGYSFRFEDIAKELYRVTKNGGIVVWVVGDATIKGSETLTSFRQAIYFKEVGFNIHDTMIFEKGNSFGTSGNPPCRYSQNFEYMFILSKGKPKTFNPIKVPCVKAGYLVKGTTRKNRQSDGRAFDELRHIEREISKTKIASNIFKYQNGYNHTTKDKIAFKHPAMFPEKLAEDHIISWSNEADIVMDIFMGSGTTAKMAILNSRKYIGFEISEEYCKIAEKRINKIII